MKTKRWFLVLLAILAGSLVFGGCEINLDDEGDYDYHHGKKKSDNSGVQVYYTVNFIVLGGPNVPPTQTIKYGERVTEPVVKDLNNNIYEVIWYTDQAFTMPYIFSMPVIENKTLYGKWKLDEQPDTKKPSCQ
jgi:hypothetical protein